MSITCVCHAAKSSSIVPLSSPSPYSYTRFAPNPSNAALVRLPTSEVERGEMEGMGDVERREGYVEVF